MALRFCDSVSHYAAANITQKWTGEGLTGPPTLTIGTGRLAGGSIHYAFGGTSGSRWAFMTLDNQQTWIIGHAFKCDTLPAGARVINGLRDAGTNQVDVRINNDGTLSVTRNGTVLATGTTALSAATWYYIEFKCKIDPTVGTYEVRLNGSGSAEISGSGANTRNTANSTANQPFVGSQNAGTNWAADWCDIYFCDTTGSTNNDFLGDVRVEALFPNGNGNSSQFTGSDGNSTDNYLLVDESTPNDDTDYVEDSTVTDKDTYAYTNPTPTTGTVYGVQTVPYARKTDAGTRSIRELARLSATEIDNGADITLSTSYLYYPKVFETKPGGGAWTLSDVSSAEFGYKVAA